MSGAAKRNRQIVCLFFYDGVSVADISISFKTTYADIEAVIRSALFREKRKAGGAEGNKRCEERGK